LKICTLTTTTVMATVVTAAFVGIVSPSTAAADQAIDASAHGLGFQATLVNGEVVQGWTVSALKPSTDAIPYPVQGTLWEATATDEAIEGSVIPIVPDLNARTPSGQTYRSLFQVATAQGVNPATLAQGQKTTGKVYFDVTGDQPSGVVYVAAGQDLASWVPSPAPQRRSGSATTTAAASGPVTTPPPAAAPTPAASQQTPASSPATPAPAGSQGTPIPGSQRTPIPASSPTPAPQASPPPPAPEASPPPPAPAAGQQPPVGSPATPTPAGPPAGTAPGGSQGSGGSPATSATSGNPATPTP
jgi:hypothetical protein